jgi:hypothetical protein
VDVVPIPQLQDNYAYLIVDRGSGEAAIVDCAEAGPVLDEVRRQGVRLTRASWPRTTTTITRRRQRHLLNQVTNLRIYGSAGDAPGRASPIACTTAIS